MCFGSDRVGGFALLKEDKNAMLKWLVGWIKAIIKAIILIRKYGVHGANDHIAKMIGKARMEYFNKTGQAWKPDDQQ